MEKENLVNILNKLVEKIGKIETYNFVNSILYKMLGIKHPVLNVKLIPIDKIVPNEYNPNSVADMELNLLYTSIKSDGYTQPSVVFYNKEEDRYIIVDGFHRYLIMKTKEDIRKSTNNHLPCVVIDKDIKERIASTIRHNRARGKHAITEMINIVYELLNKGWDDDKIMKELGMEKEELLRLKHISGFSALFSNIDYNKAWETEKQIYYRKKYENSKKEIK
jgi:ParB-like chromosome segregation protein Spo0J